MQKELVLFQQSSAQTSKTDCAKILSELISSMQKRCIELEQLMETQKKSALAQAAELKQQLESELDELRRMDTELQQLSCTDDIVYLMQVQATIRLVSTCYRFSF